MKTTIFDAVAEKMKARIKTALAAGHTIEDVADEFTDLLNQVQKEWAEEQTTKVREDAATALAKALTAFGKAYTGEDVPVSTDQLKNLGDELANMLRGNAKKDYFVRFKTPDFEDLKSQCEAFYNGWKTP